MNWQIFVALLIAIPVILVPVAVAWYFDAGSMLKTIKARMKR